MLHLTSVLVATAVTPLQDPAPVAELEHEEQVESLEIKILSTMLAEGGGGEWGFGALVEVDGRAILFDTGKRPDTVLENARELGVDLSRVTDVVLSHNHFDHTGGLLTLRREISKANPAAFSQRQQVPADRLLLGRAKGQAEGVGQGPHRLRDHGPGGGRDWNRNERVDSGVGSDDRVRGYGVEDTGSGGQRRVVDEVVAVVVEHDGLLPRASGAVERVVDVTEK